MSSSGPAPGLGLRLCLNDFLIETELARTAVGTVYKAKHGKTGKPVVLKARRSAEIGKNGNIEHEVSAHLYQGSRHALGANKKLQRCLKRENTPDPCASTNHSSEVPGAPAPVPSTPKHH
jgi:hypothetical protein